MSPWNYFNFLSLAILFCHFLLLGPSSQVLAEPGSQEQVVIQVVKFAGPDNAPDWLRKGGHRMLEDALLKANSPVPGEINSPEFVKIVVALREEKDMHLFLQVRQRRKDLPEGIHGGSTGKEVKIDPVNYILRTDYIIVSGGQVQIVAKMAKTEGAVAPISSGLTFPLEDSNRRDLFQILAEDLVNGIYKTLGKDPPTRKLNLIIPAFDGPKDWEERAKQQVPDILATVLTRFKIKDFRVKEPKDRIRTEGKDWGELVKMFPTAHLFLIGNIRFDQNKQAIINLKILDREGERRVSTLPATCAPESLFGEVFWKKRVDELKKGWESAAGNREKQ